MRPSRRQTKRQGAQMGNHVAEEKRRKQKQFMLSQEAIDYIELKAPLFARGKKGGGSRALEAMVIFAKKYEEDPS